MDSARTAIGVRYVDDRHDRPTNSSSTACTSQLTGTQSKAGNIPSASTVDEADSIETRSENSDRFVILRTLAIIIAAYGIIFTAYRCLEGLQSSLNFEGGVGTASMGVLYAVYCLSSVGTGPAMVTRFTPKWALMTAWFSHTLLICANFYPTWATLIPASVLLGFMSPIVWITQGLYFTELTKRYSLITRQNLQTVMGRFSAALDQVESLSQLLASALIAGILHPAVHMDVDKASHNDLANSSEFYADYGWGNTTGNGSDHAHKLQRDVSVCGPNHCPYLEYHTDVLVKPDQTLVYILLGTLLGSNILGILTTCFLPNMDAPSTGETGCKKCMEPIKLFANKRLYLMMWICAHVEFTKSIYAGAFHQSFISCTLGVAMVGYTFMTVAMARSLSAILSGELVKYIPRVYHYVLGCLLHVVEGVIWLVWHPRPEQIWMFFVVAALHGTALGVEKLHARSLTVDVFCDQPQSGFAQSCLWYAFGACLAFSLNSVLCVVTKAALIIAISIVAGVCFVLLEVSLWLSGRTAAREVQVDDEVDKEQREHFMLQKNSPQPDL